MLKRLVWMALLSGAVLAPDGLSAQDREVKGTVVRAEDKQPLSDAIVSLVGGRVLTRTGPTGRFTISVPAGAVRLAVRAIGYRRQEVAVGPDESEVVIALVQDVFKLDEVVVTGQATGVERRNAATSTAIVTGEDINVVPSTSVDRALQGRIAGANIQANSGAPGAGMQIQIRGNNTVIGAPDPLIVVDGVIYSNNSIPSGLSSVTVSSRNVNQGDKQDDATNRLADLDQNDIQSIEVLKSAAASSIYGAKAANGVVIITTKRGQVGKPHATISQRVGFSELLRGPAPRAFDTTQAFALYANSGDPVADSTAQVLVRSFLVNGQLPVFDHLKEVAGNKPANYESLLDVSGGTEATKYYASGSWSHDGGIVTNTKSERQGLRFNLETKLSSRFDFTLTNAFTRNANDKGFTNNDNGGGSITYVLAYIPSFIPLTPVNGVYSKPAINYFNANPLQTVQLAKNNETTVRYTGGASLTFHALSSDHSSLNVVAAGGLDFFNQKNKLVAPADLLFEQIQTNPGTVTLGDADSRAVNWNLNALHTYAPASQAWRASTSLGMQYEDQQLNRSRVTARGVPSGQTNVNQGAVLTGPVELDAEERSFAFYGQEEVLTLQERLLVSAGLRAERSSVFGDVKKYFVYPKVSGSYRFPGLLGEGSEFKIRAAYGHTGNQPLFGQKFTTLTGGQVIDGKVGTVVSNTSGSPNIKPERIREIEGGIDAEVWQGKANFQVTVYRRTTSDLLLSGAPIASSGFGEIIQNGGHLRNSGIEIAAGIAPITTPDFNWTFQTTFQRNRNLVLDLPDSNGFRPTSAGFGLSFGEFFVQPGRPAAQIIVTDDQGNTVFVGDANPDFKWSFINDFTYRGLTLSSLIDWQHGGFAQNQTLSLYDCNGLAPDGGQPSGQARTNACLNTGDGRPFVQSTTFLRVREISLAYAIPRGVAQRLFAGAESARISLTARNPFIHTNYFGYDPESSNFGQQAITRNIDLGPYPPSRSFAFNITVGF